MKKISRRSFGKIGLGSLAFGLAALQTETSKANIVGANDRIRCGFVGLAKRGSQLVEAFREHKDVRVAALCDIDRRTLDAISKENPDAATTGDYRTVLDDKGIDAVVIATPDHWHAIQMIDSCRAGKDVYIEKPLCVAVKEGRVMVQAARKYNRVVQVGLHRRSSTLLHRLAGESIRNKIGQVTVSRCYRLSNMYPDGIGKAAPGEAPEHLDWNLWLGPRPLRPYQATLAPYKFRWWDLYSSQAANWGVHYLDVIRWQLNELGPTSVCAMGGKFAVNDDRTIPDTLEVCFQFGNRSLAIFGQYEACGNPAMATGSNGKGRGEIEFRGTQGSLYLSGGKYTVIPENAGQFQKKGPRAREESGSAPGCGEPQITIAHARNFLDCMRSRKDPHADIETGHRSTTMSLIANISLALGRRLDWNLETETFVNAPEADSLLQYEYRSPWKLEV